MRPPPTTRDLWGGLELEKSHIDRAIAKASLAVAKVILPHPLEFIVEAEPFDLWPSCQKPFTPVREGARVTIAEGLMQRQFKPSARGLSADNLDRRQHSAGKDIALNEIRLLPVLFKARFIDRNRLQ
jgi:hypothetical protein